MRVLLVDVHLVPHARELLRRRETRRTRPDDGDLLAGLVCGHLGHDPAFLVPLVDDGALDRLDGDRLVVDVERAGRFARRGAHAPRHFGKVVRRMQVVERLLPVPAVDEVVPVRDLVVHRTAVVAVGNAAIHAARGLRLHLARRQRNDEFLPVLQPLLDGLVMPVLAVELHEASDLAHCRLHFE